MIMIIDFVAFSMHHTAPTKLVWVGAWSRLDLERNRCMHSYGWSLTARSAAISHIALK
jgi:hypothetical protein